MLEARSLKTEKGQAGGDRKKAEGGGRVHMAEERGDEEARFFPLTLGFLFLLFVCISAHTQRRRKVGALSNTR